MKNESLSEEIRKLQLTGRSSYVISLPKQWVLNLNLKPGEQIAVKKLDDSSLLLVPRKKLGRKETKEITATVPQTEDPNAVARRLISLYLVGYEIVHVKARNTALSPLLRSTIRDTVRKKLIGTEIIAENPDTITLQVLLSYPELSIENAMRRMATIASFMHIDADLALRDFNKDLARSVIDSDDEVDRFNLYIIRQLKAAVQDQRAIKDMGLTNPRECLGYRLAAEIVERVADYAVAIAKNVLLMEKPASERIYRKIFELNSLGNKLFEDSMSALFKRDYNLAENVIKRVTKNLGLEEDIANMILNLDLSAKETSTLRLILESSRRIIEYAEDVAEVTLNRTVEQATS